MRVKTTCPQVKAVKALSGKRLRVTFSNNVTKVYDCRPLLQEDVFRPLRDEGLFRCAQADPHGYGVIWNDHIDLAESELWLHGEPAERDAGSDV
jgi:hypothetical protein